MTLRTELLHTDVIWRALDDAVRDKRVASITGASSDVDLSAIGHLITARALAGTQSNDDDLWKAGAAALVARADVLRTILGDAAVPA